MRRAITKPQSFSQCDDIGALLFYHPSQVQTELEHGAEGGRRRDKDGGSQ